MREIENFRITHSCLFQSGEKDRKWIFLNEEPKCQVGEGWRIETEMVRGGADSISVFSILDARLHGHDELVQTSE
jgi:hypothetical protein